MTRAALTLIVLNELRGLLFVASILAANGWDMGALIQAVGL